MQAKAPLSSTTPIIQYVCSHCKTILKETANLSEAAAVIIERSAIHEDCPTCGSPLSDNISAIRRKPTTITSTTDAAPTNDVANALVSPVAFSLASDFYSSGGGSRLTFGISELDRQFSLQVGEGSCIHGACAQILIERLCARALMPAKAGGLASEKVVFIDGGNSSDVYRFVEYCRLFGLDYRDSLRRIVQSRAFTVYQLTDLITNHLVSVVETTGAKAIFIADLFEMFEREPNLDEGEGRRLASKMVAALQRILPSSAAVSSSGRQQQKRLIVISLSHKSVYDGSLEKFSKHVFFEDTADRPTTTRSGFATLRLQDKYSKLVLKVAGLV
jgi:hypothetical protein